MRPRKKEKWRIKAAAPVIHDFRVVTLFIENNGKGKEDNWIRALTLTTPKCICECCEAGNISGHLLIDICPRPMIVGLILIKHQIISCLPFLD